MLHQLSLFLFLSYKFYSPNSSSKDDFGESLYGGVLAFEKLENKRERWDQLQNLRIFHFMQK